MAACQDEDAKFFYNKEVGQIIALTYFSLSFWNDFIF